MALIPENQYHDHFRDHHQRASYYNNQRTWDDYAPAYKYGYDQYGQHRGRRLEDADNDLERGWERAKGNSRLAWHEAKEAVRDGWHHIERAAPGDADHDGR